MWNASRFCVSSLRRGHANLLCIVPILVYVLPKQVQGKTAKKRSLEWYYCNPDCYTKRLLGGRVGFPYLRPCGLMDKAPDFGSGDCRFESCHGRYLFCPLFFHCQIKGNSTSEISGYKNRWRSIRGDGEWAIGRDKDQYYFWAYFFSIPWGHLIL